MSIADMLAPCFDPLICDRAEVLTGVLAGKSVSGIYDEVERAIPMGRTKVSSGFGAFVAKSPDVDGVVATDELKIGKKTVSVYSINDDMFGMTVLTVMEIESGR